MNILLLMMGGIGTRFGSDTPKQYTIVDALPVFAYILKGYQSLDLTDKIVIISHASWIDYVQEWVGRLGADKTAAVVAGGETRSESLLNGLTAAKEFADDNDVVLIHDATHPYVDAEGTAEVISAVTQYGGATLGALQYDTCYFMEEQERFIRNVAPRREMVVGASPEAFRFGDIYRIYSQSSKDEFEKMTSAGAIAIAHGISMKVIPARVINLKITYPEDIELFRKLVHTCFFPEQ